MSYVDGYVLPMPKKHLAKYRRIATVAGKVWTDHGALAYWECAGDDLKAMNGLVPFTKSVKAKPGETVVFAWIVFKSKADRARVNKKVMKDPRLANLGPKDMPFDLKRMIYGGFKPIVVF